MRTLVKSLRRLYLARKIAGKKIRDMEEAKTITTEEAAYILGVGVIPH